MLMRQKEYKHLPVLVMANKTEHEAAITPYDLYMRLREKEPIKINFQPCSAKTGDGVIDGIKQLYDAVKYDLTSDRTSASVNDLTN